MVSPFELFWDLFYISAKFKHKNKSLSLDKANVRRRRGVILILTGLYDNSL